MEVKSFPSHVIKNKNLFFKMVVKSFPSHVIKKRNGGTAGGTDVGTAGGTESCPQIIGGKKQALILQTHSIIYTGTYSSMKRGGGKPVSFSRQNPIVHTGPTVFYDQKWRLPAQSQSDSRSVNTSSPRSSFSRFLISAFFSINITVF